MRFSAHGFNDERDVHELTEDDLICLNLLLILS